MHIPDGFLSPTVFISGWGAAIGTLSFALKKTRKILKDKTVPLMGLMAVFIFTAQMLDFPVPGGTSGHLLGGVLSSITLGPYAGAIVLSAVLIVQCLIFQDGGLTALGANIFNMAAVGTILSYYLYAALRKLMPKINISAAVFISSWFSIVLVAVFCALELSISGTSPLNIVLPAMVFVHMFIGIVEAIITTFILSFIMKVRPDLIYGGKK